LANINDSKNVNHNNMLNDIKNGDENLDGGEFNNSQPKADKK
jgi:hypothetical protein